ncbi:hypothetical protein LX32DRAFT_73184 [Colletotrichum zoysiae]|uniref:Uncharacterized protein n=1 Tax=Colletotrichum zoysiae TaxID=1216348 RepID=A0AAD9HS51_9PEZI|nr:hypothetical protein LX32DRAFT_73184 [Colletotrichum zoysiae]
MRRFFTHILIADRRPEASVGLAGKFKTRDRCKNRFYSYNTPVLGGGAGVKMLNGSDVLYSLCRPGGCVCVRGQWTLPWVEIPSSNRSESIRRAAHTPGRLPRSRRQKRGSARLVLGLSPERERDLASPPRGYWPNQILTDFGGLVVVVCWSCRYG